MDHDQRLALAVTLAAPYVNFTAANNPTQGTNVAVSRIVQAYEAIQRADEMLQARATA
jgi:hypothetical protein